jgi:hypothetical protein
MFMIGYRIKLVEFILIDGEAVNVVDNFVDDGINSDRAYCPLWKDVGPETKAVTARLCELNCVATGYM